MKKLFLLSLLAIGPLVAAGQQQPQGNNPYSSFQTLPNEDSYYNYGEYPNQQQPIPYPQQPPQQQP